MELQLNAKIRGPDGVSTADLVYSLWPCWLRVMLPNEQVIEATCDAPDLLHCLLEVRRQLEERHIRLCVQGALPNVWPSGMARQMSGGLKAYRRVMGQPTRMDDLVNIIDPADCDEVVTEAEQRAWLKRWFDDLKEKVESR